MQRLFLYGTLLADTDTPIARWLAPKLRRSRRSSIKGRMVAVPSQSGYYPAVLPATDHRRVHGVLVEAALSPQDWWMLDLYEGAQYRREQISVFAAGGSFRAAHYRWAGVLPPGALPITYGPIASGDFTCWLHERGAVPYRGS